MTHSHPISRRTALKVGAGAAALALPSLGWAGAAQVLRYTLDSDPPVLDPLVSSAYSSREHGYLIFDTLFGQDSSYKASPQMVEGTLVEDDGKRWTLTLRQGLKFHDGEPVLARDCVASIRRWGQRHALGQSLMVSTDELSAADDRRIVFRLKKRFPLLPDALGSWITPMPAMMPERLAQTDAFTQVKEMIGSGPFRFRADERIAGTRLVYERFGDYQPRESGTADFTSGPKVAHFDRVEWTVLPDASTSVAALQKGEQDWWRIVTDWDLLPLLRRSPAIRLIVQDPLGDNLILRMNQLHPPFDNPGIRRALLSAVRQEDFVGVLAGNDPSIGRTGVGYFPPDSPMATDAGLEALTGPRDIERTRREVTAAGYKGERVVLVANTGIYQRLSVVGADFLTKVGLNVDYRLSDFGTWIQRIYKKDPVEQGGWSCYFGDSSGHEVTNPAVSSLLRGKGASNPRPGWPTSPKLEELRDAWLDAPDLAAQRKIATEVQLQAFRDVPYIPLGLVYVQSAYRADLTGLLSGFPLFWNVRRQG